ncbi:ATP-binding protein [Roseateles albus]|uniref:histidine kinase n=1 Tax=Roseateles albus TaxID=2987525 RepID=A0ABT5KII7_9BURK|nr:ATP-binding protein [Roseateles albus]MDC8773737.1 ATP-binding protein [Roseateles albus]
MKRLANMPIRSLSVMLIMAVCVGTLLLSSLIHIAYESRNAKQALGLELTTVATLLGNRSTAAIAFDDRKTANENLASLRDVRHVVLACLYGDQGELFAQYQRDDPSVAPNRRSMCPPAPPPEQDLLQIQAEAIRVRFPVSIDQQRLAQLFIDSSLETVNASILRQLKLQIGVVLLAAVLALLAALRMQRLISRPIQDLSGVARAIVSTHDYSLRASPAGPVELIALASAFNRLIATIEQQNAELESGRIAALGRFERLRADQAVLSELAKSSAATGADVALLAGLMCRRLLGFFQLGRVSVGVHSEADGTDCFETASKAAGSVAAQKAGEGVLRLGIAHWAASGERYLAVSDCASESRLGPNEQLLLGASGPASFLWAAAGSSQSGQLSYVCFEVFGPETRSWSSDDIALACELADLIALVERDSRRRRAERSLRASDAYNKLLFRESCMPQGILDPTAMRFVDCNRAALAVFGFSRPAQLLGLSPAEVAPALQADGGASADLLVAHIRAALHGELSVFEMQLLRAGQPPWEAEVHLDRFESETATLVQFSLIDISTRVQAQRAMASLNQELELRVERRTAALSDANQQLSDTLETLQETKDELVRNERLGSLGALVAGVAHELNTPIGNSLVVASTLQDGAGTLAAEVAAGTVRRSSMASYLDMAKESSALLMRNLQRAAELVSRFKQMAADQTSGQRRQFELRSTVEDMVNALQSQFAATPHKLLADIPAGIHMDSWPGDLERVLTQLVGNTLVHAHQGEKAGCTRISASLHDKGQRVRLIVADDGRGIDPKSLPRIFDPFFTTRLGSGGNGLGLHTVFSLVTKSLGGRISVESELGQGSRFIVDVPCVAPQASQYRDFPH